MKFSNPGWRDQLNSILNPITNKWWKKGDRKNRSKRLCQMNTRALRACGYSEINNWGQS